MAYPIHDFQDILRALEQHPEWREALLRLLLQEDFLSLPAQARRLEDALARLSEEVRALTEAQRRTEERLEALTEAQQRTEARLKALAEAQLRTEEHLQALAQRVDDLTVRLEALTARVDQLAQRVDDLTVRLEALTARVDQLTQRVDDLTVRLEALTARVDQLAEAQRRTEEAVQETQRDLRDIAVRLAGLEVRMERQERRTDELLQDVAQLKGLQLEHEWRERAPARLGRVFRRPRVLSFAELEALLEDALAQGLFTEEEADRLREADLVVEARRKRDGTPVRVALEVSWTVYPEDVERAVERARLLERLGLPGVPVVAGRGIHGDATERARREGVWVLLDGRALAPDGAPEAGP